MRRRPPPRHGLCAATGVALVIAALASAPAPAAAPEMHGRAAAAALVQRGQVRFTVLTPRVIRREWSPDGRFVDEPSQVFV